jgi:UDP-GlcNAc:undecaprenyl-phosphate GlcNAc-1-phosphate transferase
MWLLGMTYTTKLLDGLDGLATGVTTVGAVMIALLALSSAFFQPDVALLSMMFAAALFGFWLWNMYPAKIFLGEGGSTFLGYALGVLAIISGSKLATTLLVVGLPVLDVLVVIGRRWYQGKPIMKGDRSHLHHALLDAGLSPRLTVLVYMSVASLFGVTTLIFASWQKVIALGILTMISFLFIQVVYRKAQMRYENK